MTASVLSLFSSQTGWTNDQRAQFARIEKLLDAAGIAVEGEHGISDEGEPWCAICSLATGEVIVHAAAIDGRFIIDSVMIARPIKGRSFENCAERFFENSDLAVTRVRSKVVSLHPSALLASMMLTFLLYAEAVSERAPFRGRAEDEAEEGEEASAAAAGDKGPNLSVRLKQLAQQAAEFAADTAAGATSQGQAGAQANGLGPLMPAGMALAMLALVQDISKTLSAAESKTPAEGERRAQIVANAEGDAAGAQAQRNATVVEPREAIAEGAEAEADAEAPDGGKTPSAVPEEAEGRETVASGPVARERPEVTPFWSGAADAAQRSGLDALLDVDALFTAAFSLDAVGIPGESGSLAAGDEPAVPLFVLDTVGAAALTFEVVEVEELMAAVGSDFFALLTGEPGPADEGLAQSEADSDSERVASLSSADDHQPERPDRFDFEAEGGAPPSGTPGSRPDAPGADADAPQPAPDDVAAPGPAPDRPAGPAPVPYKPAPVISAHELLEQVDEFQDMVGAADNFRVGEDLFVIDQPVHAGFESDQLAFDTFELDDGTRVTFVGYLWDFDGFA
ncbi:MAG: hypothetical protein ACFCGT_19690 [Sandaracinaceae bacterium]